MGQVILVLGAFTLLIFMTMTVNQAIGNRIGSTYQAEAIIAATTLGQSMINEISQKAFDDSVLTRTVDQVSQLTEVASLGKDGGETYATFDDVDDFKNYTRTDSIPNGYFTTSVDVVYVSPSALSGTSNVPTFYKKITVTVTANELKYIPITLTRIVAY